MCGEHDGDYTAHNLDSRESRHVDKEVDAAVPEGSRLFCISKTIIPKEALHKSIVSIIRDVLSCDIVHVVKDCILICAHWCIPS